MLVGSATETLEREETVLRLFCVPAEKTHQCAAKNETH